MILVSKLSVPGEGDPEVPTNLGRRRGSAVNLHMLAGKFFKIAKINCFFSIFVLLFFQVQSPPLLL